MLHRINDTLPNYLGCCVIKKSLNRTVFMKCLPTFVNAGYSECPGISMSSSKNPEEELEAEGSRCCPFLQAGTRVV